MAEQANFSELRNKISNWDIEAEQMLINKINIFTNSYNADFSNFTKNMQNLDNNLSNIQVQHYKAITSLKDLSMNRFIEESMDVASESVSEDSDRGVAQSVNNQVYMNEEEKIKKAMELTIKNIDEISSKKDQNKEQIEDDAKSVASSKIMFDNFKKFNLPFIIGTDDFNKEAMVGLSNEPVDNEEEEEELEDKDVKNFVEENIKVDDKTMEEWIKIEKKKKTKAEKEKLKKEKKLKKDKKDEKDENEIKNNSENNKNDFDNEVKNEIKVPIENEENDTIAVTSKVGGTVPPPPPPPPKPVLDPSKIQPKVEKKPISNEINIDKKIIDNEKQIENIQKENININNAPTNTNMNNNNIIMQPKPKIMQSMNPFLLKGLQNIPDDDDDSDDDDDLFSKKKRNIPKKDVKMNLNQSQHPFVFMHDNEPNNKPMDNINKNKLDNIFEEENENKPEEKKVIEIENPKEQIEINKEIIPPTQNIEEEKQKEQNNIFTNNETDKENIPNANKNKGFNSLFDLPEEEKNSTEVIGNKNEQKALETKKKINKIFFDDDDE